MIRYACQYVFSIRLFAVGLVFVCLAFFPPQINPAFAEVGLQVQNGYQVRSNGQAITFPKLFATTPVVLTCAHIDGKAVLSTAARVTARDFVVYMTDNAGRPATFAWVQWIAFVPNETQEVIGGVLTAGHGQHISFTVLSTTPGIVTNASKDGKLVISGVRQNAPDGFDLEITDLRGNPVESAEVHWMAVVPKIDNGFRGGFHTASGGDRVEVKPAMPSSTSYLVGGKGGIITAAVGDAPYGFTLLLTMPDGSAARNIRVEWLGFAGFAPSPVPRIEPCTNATEIYQTDLCKIKKAGIPWVRLNADKPDIVAFARQIGLDVIVVIESRAAMADHGWACADYLPDPLCKQRWQEVWQNYVKTKVAELKPFGVKVWQVDNELNNPVLNPFPAVNVELRQAIVATAAQVIRSADPNAVITVNLYAHVPTVIDDIKTYKALRDRGITLQILGMDYFRESYALGSPRQYPGDLKAHQAAWGGEIMIMETGFHTYPPHTLTDQDKYTKETFKSLDGLLRNAGWFRGIIWYEYKSNDHVPVKDYFGLHYTRDIEPKPAWSTFMDEAYTYRDLGKYIGITYR